MFASPTSSQPNAAASSQRSNLSGSSTPTSSFYGGSEINTPVANNISNNKDNNNYNASTNLYQPNTELIIFFDKLIVY
jgi:hypothetical protein